MNFTLSIRLYHKTCLNYFSYVRTDGAILHVRIESNAKEQNHWLYPVAFLTLQISLIERCLESEEACYLYRAWTPMGSHRGIVKWVQRGFVKSFKAGHILSGYDCRCKMFWFVRLLL